VILLDRVLFGVRSNWGQGLAVLASVLGVVVIVFEGDPASAQPHHFGLAEGLILCAVVVWALYTVLLRLRPAISPVSFVAITFFIGVLAMGPLAAWEWQSGHGVAWSPKVAGAFVYVALLPSLLSYFIYNHAAGVVGPARAGQAITMMPLFGAFLSAALLGETLHPFHFAGMALILVGIALGMISGAAKGRRLEGPA
jgi:drug/metabolite transporter (DMT)-like permease